HGRWRHDIAMPTEPSVHARLRHNRRVKHDDVILWILLVAVRLERDQPRSGGPSELAQDAVNASDCLIRDHTLERVESGDLCAHTGLVVRVPDAFLPGP